MMPLAPITDPSLFQYAFNVLKLDDVPSTTMLQNVWAAYRIPLISLKSFPPVSRRDSTTRPEEMHSRDGKAIFNGRCPSCNKIYKSKKDLQDHIIIHHERRYECERCTRTFVSEKRMDAHKIKKHSGVPLKKEKSDARRKVYRCGQCGRTYETYYNFKEHLAKHDGKLFECTICNKQLSGQSALSRHSKIHDKPHECMMCSSRFSSAYDLDCHFSYYHSAIKRFKCEYCERVLYNYSGKLRHERLCVARPTVSTAQSYEPPQITSSHCTASVQFARTSSESYRDNVAHRQSSKNAVKTPKTTFQIRDILCDIPEFQSERFASLTGIASVNQTAS